MIKEAALCWLSPKDGKLQPWVVHLLGEFGPIARAEVPVIAPAREIHIDLSILFKLEVRIMARAFAVTNHDGEVRHYPMQDGLPTMGTHAPIAEYFSPDDLHE